MPYSDEQVEEMEVFYRESLDRADAMTTQLFVRAYRHQDTREVIVHGFYRRLDTLRHCIERVFEELPPQEEKPERGTLMDVTVMVQAFYINVLGAIDNLARIWVREANVTLANGDPLPDRFIGFTARNRAVRDSLPAPMKAYLTGTRNTAWFDYLENYRHALAHRIPLYVPPKQVNEAEAEEARQLEEEVCRAYREDRIGDVPGLRSRQISLGRFEPMIMHSYGEGARPVRFHVQMLTDYSTVIEFAEHVLAEVDDLPR